MTEFRLGRAIPIIVPFIRHKQVEDKPIITNNLIIIMLMVVIAKIAILLTL